MAERARVLVVDDDPDIRDLVAMVLTRLDVDIVQAATGADALELARALPPHLVTLDLGLPDMDGIETCRRLREFSDAYVLILTAREERTDREVVMGTGADAFMGKPFLPRELRTAVSEALSARGGPPV